MSRRAWASNYIGVWDAAGFQRSVLETMHDYELTKLNAELSPNDTPTLDTALNAECLLDEMDYTYTIPIGTDESEMDPIYIAKYRLYWKIRDGRLKRYSRY